ncbi:SEFIR domain-containing protein [Rhodococcus sp. NPDC056506]|uniref:SEFIR domain-containing protein n=1 Tax=Rhodococcus sp. NPDC056506 TaxID=3345844 RepID=UPI003671BCA6
MTTESPVPNSAPSCLISYSHDSPTHRQHVLSIAEALRNNGVDVTLDQYVEHTPPPSWPRWMREQIEHSDFVLVVVTKDYAERYNGRPLADRGRGADWEGLIITGELYTSHQSKVKFIPIVTNSADVQHIPAVLDQTSFHNLEKLSQDALIPLLRQIFERPSITPAPLGIPRFEIEDDPVETATKLLASNATDAETTLKTLAGSSNLDIAARAAFTLGEIYYESQQYSRSSEAFLRSVQCGPKTSVFDAARRELSNVAAVINQHYGPLSAGTFARKWISDIQAGNVPEVWQAIDKDFRVALAQDWILANKDHETLQGLDREHLADELRKLEPTHALSVHFLSSQMEKLSKIVEGIDDSWGIAEKPRRFGLDFEIIILTPTEGEVLIWEAGMNLQMLPIVLRRRMGNWLIVGTGVPPAIPIPGWPPTRQEIPLDGIGTGHASP